MKDDIYNSFRSSSVKPASESKDIVIHIDLDATTTLCGHMHYVATALTDVDSSINEIYVVITSGTIGKSPDYVPMLLEYITSSINKAGILTYTILMRGYVKVSPSLCTELGATVLIADYSKCENYKGEYIPVDTYYKSLSSPKFEIYK